MVLRIDERAGAVAAVALVAARELEQNLSEGAEQRGRLGGLGDGGDDDDEVVAELAFLKLVTN